MTGAEVSYCRCLVNEAQGSVLGPLWAVATRDQASEVGWSSGGPGQAHSSCPLIPALLTTLWARLPIKE